MELRRTAEPDDTVPIVNRYTADKLRKAMLDAWAKENLWEDQRQRSYQKQASIFTAYLHRIYGESKLVMALFYDGLPWKNEKNALITQKFVEWLKRAMVSIDTH